MPDPGILEVIRRALAGSLFRGEGYRKVWARLRHAALRTSKERVRRLMRENGPVPTRQDGHDPASRIDANRCFRIRGRYSGISG
jgi:hypothetical protein